jgi:SAM-dependent methyltransferase
MNPHLPALLEYFWLRPETAVWRALDFQALDEVEIVGPSLDLGCGDGAFSFMLAGGRYTLDYDFSSMTAAHDQFFSNVDIYDHFDASKVCNVVANPPRYRIDVGFDHKKSLLNKATMTGLYNKTLEGDGNRPLPFGDASFTTVYSNIIYWLEDYPATLREITRILRPSGQCIVQVPSEHFRDFSFYQQLFVKTGDPKWEWLKLLDRGRSENIKNCKSEAEWAADFASAGLTVESCKPYLPRLVIQAWDIGLRPISPLLTEMANELPKEKRRAIKERWVANLLPLVSPLCDTVSPENGFYLFRLRR